MKSFLFTLILLSYCIALVFGIYISSDTVSQSISILKNELKNNISTMCPEIPEELYEKTATEILFGKEPSMESELALAIRHHFLNETETESEYVKRGNLLSKENCIF